MPLVLSERLVMLEARVEQAASFPRIVQAVKNAAAGETTILSCPDQRSVARACAFAEQQRLLLGLVDEVRVSVGHGRIHLEPRETSPRPKRRAPVETERRRGPDRRRAERRQRGADDPVERAVVAVVGERRSGTERRSGHDRRSETARPVERRRSRR
jgi:hypothetical protein